MINEVEIESEPKIARVKLFDDRVHGRKVFFDQRDLEDYLQARFLAEKELKKLDRRKFNAWKKKININHYVFNKITIGFEVLS